MDDLAAPHRYTHDELPELSDDRRIRIAWLAKGITEVNSILIKIDLELAQYRDRARFEVKVFVPDQRSKVLSSPQGRKHIGAFEALGCPVLTAPDSDDTEQTLLDLAARIHEFRPHILLTSAALADFRHYFITSLKPAPIQIGLVQGPPPQFAPPTLDWCIAWTRHPLLECPVDTSWVTIYLDWPDREGVDGFSRRELDLPAEACVLLSGGRPPKFQDPEFWTVIVDLLTEYPNTYYLAVGPTEDQIPFLAQVVSAEVRPRVRCLGWRPDFLEILVNADVVIDTYPNGGGQVIVQAMSMGIPVVAHRNDYLQPFDQNNWSPVEDFLNEPDLLVERGDFARFKEILAKLIEDQDYRYDAGVRCRGQHLRQADPAVTVRRCEEIYTQLFEQYSSRRLSSGGSITSSR
jgi:glycosyltransferase involved in cell wall biosynthesis